MSISAEGFRILDELVAAGWFATQLPAYEAAIAIALAQQLRLPERQELGKLETKYNIGSLDPRVRDLVVQFHTGDTSRPYDVAQLLAEAGLRHLDRARQSDQGLSDALGLTPERGNGVDAGS